MNRVRNIGSLARAVILAVCATTLILWIAFQLLMAGFEFDLGPLITKLLRTITVEADH